MRVGKNECTGVTTQLQQIFILFKNFHLKLSQMVGCNIVM